MFSSVCNCNFVICIVKYTQACALGTGFKLVLLYVNTQQDNPLTWPLFTLTHFGVFHYSSRVFLLCLFPYLANDTHILAFPHIVSLTFD
jgi:hypothetical protein